MLLKNSASLQSHLELECGHFLVRKATTTEDFDWVLRLRYQGFKKYLSTKTAAIDRYDSLDNTCSLLAVDRDGTALGTIRIHNGKTGNIELNEYIHMESLLSVDELPYAQATRLSVPKHAKQNVIKVFLFKAYFNYCEKNTIETMVACAPVKLGKIYKDLVFENAGDPGRFNHPLVRGRPHETYKMRIKMASKLWKFHNHPYYSFVFETDHSHLISF